MTTKQVTGDKVTVLLSTYNGDRFLQQQLQSLYEQTYPNVKILVRDDDSKDDTCRILAAEYQRGAIELLESHENLGVVGSFFTLLSYAARTDTEYVAFCDQDDVWHSNILTRAVSLLGPVSHCPVLYCSCLEIVDDLLQPLGFSSMPRRIGFGNALVENIVTGCTIVLNRKAIDLLCQQQLPFDISVHDWWCYLVVSCFGEIIFDDQALIQYRQHDNNTIGAASSCLAVLKRKFTRLFNNRQWISKQAAIFHDLFTKQLPPAQCELVEHLLKAKSSFRYRVGLALSPNIWRQKCADSLILRIIILLNRI